MSNLLSTRKGSVSILLLVLAVFAVVAALRSAVAVTSARAGSPPPDQPQFEGQAVRERFPAVESSERARVPRATNDTGWQTILDETFENGLDSAKWLSVDRNGAQNGDYKWADQAFTNPLSSGTKVAWAIGGGQDGSGLTPGADGYPPGVDAWLIHGPMDFSEALDAELSFEYALDADAGDTFSVLMSTDGSNWEGLQLDNGGDGEWFGRNLSLDNYLGEPQIYLAFRFGTDSTGHKNKDGAFVDNVAVRLEYGSRQYLPHIQVQPTVTPSPSPTPPPTPTATPPSGRYIDDFTNDIDGWNSVRSSVGANYAYQHRGDDDGGRQGVLEMQITNPNAYVIVSPLVPAKDLPYNIEFYAKLKDPADRHMYGIAFGADWNGGDCFAPGTANCFTQYYELRVQYREFAGKRFQELKLKRVEGHDATGEPIGPTLIDWRKGGNVGTDDWVEIDVYVTEDGKIRLSWNGKFIVQYQDPTLINQRYWGLMLITRDNGNARVKYDYVKID